MDKIILDQINESIKVKSQIIDNCLIDIKKSINILVTSFKNGNKLLICGNGGSAADSQHIAAELISSFRSDFMRPSLPAIALTTDTSMLTAYSNDFGYEGVFARQVEGLGKKGDVLIGLSTSGNSKNVVKAFEEAKTKGLHTIALTGHTGGKLKELADVSIVVPSAETPRIQESHILIYHIICDLVEIGLFK